MVFSKANVGYFFKVSELDLQVEMPRKELDMNLGFRGKVWTRGGTLGGWQHRDVF